jgi:hypothetical protein
MAFEQKEGNFACFQKTSKAGGQYFNGKVVLQGKEYSVSIFEKVSKRGDKYLSGIIDEPRGQQETQSPTVKKVDSFNEDFLNDEIPFNLSRINGDYK